ncbi:hypothetical protein D9619_006746 [Psilocybe cf. subviscida]|uniref:F-box domain-containing protein n=1 Tax=Psilocybe cf. subviscida TaxID=2480587 RepID=A0A8H5B6C9_9AGAR|nr:hypothetical protein D9619_006746 [Psilocybe cf. subviscida]
MADEDEVTEDGAPCGMTGPEGEEFLSLRRPHGAFLWTHNPTTYSEFPAYYVPPSHPNKILSLPAELTSTIFGLVDDDWVKFMKHYYFIKEPNEPFVNVPLRPGFTFLHVCRRWRQVALSHKKLWATFVHVTPNEVISLPLLSFYLEQSTPHPLDIVIRTQNFYWVENEEPNDLDSDSEDMQDDDQEDSKHSFLPWTTTDVRRVLDALIPHAARWRRFALNICIGGFDTAALLPIRKIDAPLLEGFEVLMHSQRRQDGLRSIPDTEDFIVALRGDEPDPFRQRVIVKQLTSARFDVRTLHMFAPSFADLTVLELRNSHFIQLPRKIYTNMFESAPRLVHVSFMRCHVLDLEFDEQLDSDDDDDLTMHAPCLEVIRSFTSDMSMYMWKYLEAPRLRDIVLADANLPKLPLWIKGAWDDTFEADQVQPPFPRLERLVLQNCNEEDLSNRQLLLICRMTRPIEQLVLLRDGCILDAMFKAGNNPLLWPNLRVLKFANSYIPQWNDHDSGDVSSLAGLVEWRNDAFGIQCIIEGDNFCCDSPQIVSEDEKPTGEDFSLHAQENVARFNGLIHRGLARWDPVDYWSTTRPIWPPPVGQERPANVYDLWHIDLLGARGNPWY